MKNETIDKIENDIIKKTVMPDNLKGKTRKEIFTNLILAIGMVLYFIFLIMGSADSTKTSRTLDFRIFSLVLLFVSICLFEIAYKKENGKIAINGIEFLVIALITLFFPYIVFELDRTHQIYYFMTSGYIAVYYIIKSIVISKRAKTKYKKQESDIKEIVKKEEKKEDYLDEDLENDETVEKNKVVEQINKEKNKEDKKVIEEKTKRRGRPKKDGSNLDVKDIKTNKKTKKDEKSSKDKEDDKPKKRGRPRKVVNS